MPVIPITQELKVGRPESKTGPDKSLRPYLKNKLKQKGWKCDSRDSLPSKCMALSSIPSTTKNKPLTHKIGSYEDPPVYEEEKCSFGKGLY
jgi:hypothetical protein